jgi:hypothetical protein
MRTTPSFPVAGRDFVVARYDLWGEKEGSVIVFSIEHEDLPKFPKVVRGEIIVSGMYVKENEAGNEVSYTSFCKKFLIKV